MSAQKSGLQDPRKPIIAAAPVELTEAETLMVVAERNPSPPCPSRSNSTNSVKWGAGDLRAMHITRSAASCHSSRLRFGS